MHLDKILITGASSGLGKNLAIYFASKGHDIIISGRNNSNLRELKKILEQQYKIKCSIVVGDLTDIDSIKEIARFCIENEVNVLINNAGMLCAGKQLSELSIEYIDDMLKINLLAPILLTKFLSNKVGKIININSIAGLENKKNRTIYCTSKSALKTFSNTFCLETNIKMIDIFISKIKNFEEDYGLNYNDVCDKIYESYTNNIRNVIIDGRKHL
jgi:short-subunit dehydrogenase